MLWRLQGCHRGLQRSDRGGLSNCLWGMKEGVGDRAQLRWRQNRHTQPTLPHARKGGRGRTCTSSRMPRMIFCCAREEAGGRQGRGESGAVTPILSACGSLLLSRRSLQMRPVKRSRVCGFVILNKEHLWPPPNRRAPQCQRRRLPEDWAG
jgi:hypothetical protein